MKRRALALVLLMGLFGPSCLPIDWSEQPLVAITEPDCEGWLKLLRWGHGDGPNVVVADHGDGPNVVVADRLWRGDCVAGFDRALWSDLYLGCARDEVTVTSRTISRLVVGSERDELAAACERIITASSR